MKPRFRIYQRDGMYYSFDRTTGKRESLQTAEKHNAIRLVHAKNEGHAQPALNLQLARTYLSASDPELIRRSWSDVLASLIETKSGSTKIRWQRAAKDAAYAKIIELTLLETTAAHFLQVLNTGTVATNVFLRQMHNFALDLDWIPKAILPRKRWPPIVYKERRAITFEEHQKIIEKERNVELQAFYQLCWHLGGSQSDVANLKAEDVDWGDRIIAYYRGKTGTPALVSFGREMAGILQGLPGVGLLFPRLAAYKEKHRAKEFRRRCVSVGISGVTLHSYRYAWAERARILGMSERGAMEMLGHNSKAVHRAYSKKAQVRVPSLEEFKTVTHSN